MNPDQTSQQNIWKPEFWLIWRPKMGLLCLSFTHLQKSLQWACKSSFKWIKQKRFKKIEENLYIGLFWPYLDPENLAHGGHFSHMKTFWENGQKLSKFQIFTYIFVIKDPLKLEAKNKNFSSTSFGAILLCTFTPNIGMIRWKLREPIGFEKKSWWTPEGSVSDKLRWPGQKLGWKGA